ncbi:HAD family hydrolase [Clostridium hydrogenum]|uniref:HAD family hydrolase n=1 Tax=Clostridium hydrogenum TaxID=2855764 RepID=UPI001F34A1E3|nr:HAD family phosphatase [Clostridium hydrogenum]
MIKNVIFDIGNVLLKFTPVEFLKSKFDDEELVDSLYKNIFLSKEWIELDRGTITDEEAIDIYCSRDPKHEKQIKEVMETWCEMHIPVEGTSEFLRKLKEKGYKIYLLSNYHLKAFELISSKYDFIKNVDGEIISYRVKLIKPDAAIYKSLIDKYNLKVEESVFIDDTPQNIEAAKKIGLHGVVFNGAKNMEKELGEIGVAI